MKSLAERETQVGPYVIDDRTRIDHKYSFGEFAVVWAELSEPYPHRAYVNHFPTVAEATEWAKAGN